MNSSINFHQWMENGLSSRKLSCSKLISNNIYKWFTIEVREKNATQNSVICECYGEKIFFSLSIFVVVVAFVCYCCCNKGVTKIMTRIDLNVLCKPVVDSKPIQNDVSRQCVVSSCRQNVLLVNRFDVTIRPASRFTSSS